MLPENKRVFEFLGIYKWLEKGITGNGITAASGENFSAWPYEHAGQTYRTFKEFCPGADVKYIPADELIENIPAIKRDNISVMFSSLALCRPGDNFDNALSEIADRFLCFAAVGNKGVTNFNYNVISKYIRGVGAVWYAPDGTIIPWSYSYESEYVEFSSPTKIWIPGVGNTYTELFDGTSCAAPIIAAEAALIYCFFLQKTGHIVSANTVLSFMIKNCKDIFTPGRDEKTGYGIPILPDPDTINIYDYMEDEPVYTDNDKIPSWAMEAVKTVTAAGIMTGNSENEFMPDKPITRAEIAVIIARVINV